MLRMRIICSCNDPQITETSMTVTSVKMKMIRKTRMKMANFEKTRIKTECGTYHGGR